MADVVDIRMNMTAPDTTIRSSQALPLRAYLRPVAMLTSLWLRRELIWQLARRDILSRYRAANLGLLWSVLTPLATLAIYTFVFAVVFQARWGTDPSETTGEFALALFAGMLLYGLFAEVTNRAPGLVVANANYVKKVVFPLEVFVPSALLTALINMMIGYLVWLVGWMIIERSMLPASALWFPLVILPVCLTTAGIGWILASLGVFLRDIGHATQIVVQLLFFVTPIFYSIDRVPEPYRSLLAVNPLAHAVEDIRRALIWGLPPVWSWWLGTTLTGAALTLFGYAFFMKSRKAFGDVI